MSDLQVWFQANAPILWAVLALAIIIMGVLVVGLFLQVSRVASRASQRTGPSAPLNGSSLPTGLAELIERHGARLDELTQAYQHLEAVSRTTIQRVGLVRFNPFQDTGGDQSFVLALMDMQGNGVVISGLHSRTSTRLYTKAIYKGQSTHPLSAEEQQAIREAYEFHKYVGQPAGTAQ